MFDSEKSKVHSRKKIAKMACFKKAMQLHHIQILEITHLYGFVKTHCFIFFLRGCSEVQREIQGVILWSP